MLEPVSHDACKAEDDLGAEFGRALKEAEEVALEEAQHYTLGSGAGSGGAWRFVQQGHLAEELAFLQESQFLVAGLQDDGDLTGEDDVHTGPGHSLGEYVLACGICAAVKYAFDGDHLALAEVIEDRKPAQYCEGFLLLLLFCLEYEAPDAVHVTSPVYVFRNIEYFTS